MLFVVEDGRVMDLDPAKIGLKGVEIEVDQHSRQLQKKDDLSGN